MARTIISPNKGLRSAILTCLFVLSTATLSIANEWIPVTGAETLQKFMGSMKAERKLPNGEISRGEYRPDGTGTLHAWGASIPRFWEVKEGNRICITAERKTTCYQIERNSDNQSRYRARNIETGMIAEFKVTAGQAIVTGDPENIDNDGSAATPSAEELAAELSNPNTAVATLTFKNQFRWFEGDLPDADNQSSYTLLFQPAFPFVLDSGNKILWRPAVPFIVDQPVIDPLDGGFGNKTGLGDIVFDLAYAPQKEGGQLLAYGIIASLPTATDDSLGSDRWTLGPEVLLGIIKSKSIMGIFPNHQWDIGGSGDADINLTSTQIFYTHLPGGGWNVGTGPNITYDWENEQWTVPLQINIGKTVVWNGRPWKLSAELNYYVEKSDAFGPEWMLSFNVAPVVKNSLASLFGLGGE